MCSLTELNITTHTNDVIDFSKLKNFSKCYLLWWKGADSILDCSWIKYLYLDGRKTKDFSKLAKFFQIESLTLANSPIESLDWLRDIKTLKELEIFNCKKITDFSPISGCNSLIRLMIEDNKHISNIKFLAGLTSLEILNLSNNGPIESLSPLKDLKKLKAFTFTGKTCVIDGNLAILETLPQLAMLNFTPRKNYTHVLIKDWNWNNLNIPEKLLKQK